MAISQPLVPRLRTQELVATWEPLFSPATAQAGQALNVSRSRSMTRGARVLGSHIELITKPRFGADTAFITAASRRTNSRVRRSLASPPIRPFRTSRADSLLH